MKTKNKNLDKVDIQDVMVRYNVPEEQRELIEERVKRVNRKRSIPRRELESRSLKMQKAYEEIKKLDNKVIQILITAYQEYKTILKKIIANYQYQSGYKERLDAEDKLKKLARKYNVENEEYFWATLTGFQF